MAILRAIVKGERDPYRLADLCDSRIKARRQQVAESLDGTWRNELLFILKQQLEIHDALAHQVSQCDRQIETHLQTIQQKVDPQVTPMPAARRPTKLLNRKHTPQYDLRKYLYQSTRR